MRILYIHQYYNNLSMSGSTRSYEMATRFVKGGHQVDLITTSREKNKRSGWYVTVENGVRVHWLNIPYDQSYGIVKRLYAFFLFAWHATLKSCALEIDVILASSTPLTVSIPAIIASKRRSVPIVFEIRDLWPDVPIAIGAISNPILKTLAVLLEWWTYRNVQSLVVLSPDMRDSIINKNKFPASKVGVIPNCCDIDLFQLGSTEKTSFRNSRPFLVNKPLLIYAGTLGRINDVKYLVKVAFEFKKINSNVRILIVGKGSESQNLLVLAKNLGVLNEYIFFEPQIPKKNIPKLFSSAQMASNIVINVFETWANSANKFFDTLASGKPIMINHGGWMHDFVKKNKCGISTHGMNFDEAAHILHKRLNNEKWLEVAGNNALAAAKKYFDRDVLAGKLLRVVEVTLAGNEDQVYEIAPNNFL